MPLSQHRQHHVRSLSSRLSCAGSILTTCDLARRLASGWSRQPSAWLPGDRPLGLASVTHERKAPPQLPRLARLGRQEDDDGRPSDDGVARGGAVGRRVQPLELPDLHGRRERSGRAGLRARLLPRVRRRAPRGQLRVPDLPPVRGHAAARRRPRAAREGASALQLRCAPPPPAARRAARPPPPPPASSAVGASRVAPARLSSRGRAAPRPRLAERRGHRLAAAAF